MDASRPRPGQVAAHWTDADANLCFRAGPTACEQARAAAARRRPGLACVGEGLVGAGAGHPAVLAAVAVLQGEDLRVGRPAACGNTAAEHSRHVAALWSARHACHSRAQVPPMPPPNNGGSSRLGLTWYSEWCGCSDPSRTSRAVRLAWNPESTSGPARAAEAQGIGVGGMRRHGTPAHRLGQQGETAGKGGVAGVTALLAGPARRPAHPPTCARPPGRPGAGT